jgi:hypothetical protein
LGVFAGIMPDQPTFVNQEPSWVNCKKIPPPDFSDGGI